jgi:hypothetical protein
MCLLFPVSYVLSSLFSNILSLCSASGVRVISSVFQGPDCSGPKEINPPSMQGPVVFELKGLLSPKKRMRTGFINNDKAISSEVSDKQDSSVGNNLDGKLKENRKDTRECCVENDSDGKIKKSRKELGLMTPHKMPISQHKVNI